MSNDINAIFLRFRDLVTETDETISKHKAIIDENDYVWWAWWKKGHEKTPLSEFGVLSIRAKESTINVYLVDSGNTLLWLSDLHFSNGEIENKNTLNQLSLTNHIKKCCDVGIFNDISGLIISGDLTDCCRPEGFKLTKDFISDFN